MKTIKTWKKSLPDSRIIKPDDLSGKIKYTFWRLYTPFHPLMRDGLQKLGLIKHEGRQDYLIGYVSPDWSIEQIVDFLIQKGFGNHFIAWVDDDEVVGLRYVKDFATQYHIRIFKDGEVRGHYEYTPECYPIKHMKKVGQENRKSEFLELLGDSVVAA